MTDPDLAPTPTCEGAGKKKRWAPRALGNSQTHPTTIRKKSLGFFLYVFRRFSARGVQKHHVENFFQNNRQKFRCQVFLDFLCLIAFSGVSQRWEFKNTKKNIVSKSFYKKIDQKSKTNFFSIFFITFLDVSRYGESKSPSPQVPPPLPSSSQFLACVCVSTQITPV
jgi:hypothetical protein